ncbi:hypothetical protein FDP41_007961 [Naegleria fowleri]|uniref:RCC1-like domain-containing protein n=1 Tax=Naegleria fowleri TaxID=5763 RepID=A0A6A5C8F7_NAEFO|nr:uncharacterized protein FDP41_007961 [Naegleria fowleri]KAF0984046.1 hypothetical protein FDP41_007961 [Naegleria fowleri]
MKKFFRSLSRHHLKLVACKQRSYSTSSSSLLGANNNEIYIWGSIGDEKILKPTKLFTNTPSKSYFGGEKIVDICCGSEHVIFLSDVGNLYALGNNQYGQCGHNPKEIPFAAEPTKIELKHPIKKIYSLRDSTIALATDEKTLYVFGLDDSSQLGLGYNRTGVVHTPRIIETNSLDIEKIHDLYCGPRHTFMKCRTTDGMQKLFCWGQNQFFQLQLGHTFNQNEITQALLPKGVKGSDVLGMSCGISHSILYTKDKVYSVGRGNEGQLGIPSKYSSGWQLVEMPVDKNNVIEKISSGMTHSIVVLFNTDSCEQEIVGWGSHIFFSPTPTPQRIHFEINKTENSSGNRITLLESGFHHSFIRVGNEHLYAIGCGSSYQLGQGSRINAEGRFVRVLHPNVSNIRKLASGFSLSVTIGE